MKTLRLFALLDHLRAARRPLSADLLAQRLEVSVRTIYRDVLALQALGVPVRGESGMGYQLAAGYFLPPLHFDDDELEALMLGLRLLRARRGSGLRDVAERVTGKLAAVLGPERSGTFLDLNLAVVARDRASDQLAEAWGPQVRAAIRQRRIVYLHYHSLQERRSERRIWPLGLTMFEEAWLLTAWCEHAGDFRHFRLDRIVALQPTGERFPVRKGQRFQDYLHALATPADAASQ